MDDLTQTKEKRFEFLNLVYWKSGGDEHQFFTLGELASELDLELSTAVRIAQYLGGESLIKVSWTSGGGMKSPICITHRGVIQVEKALSEPEKPTEYFPPVVNIISIASMSHSQIQQGTQQSQQTTSYGASNIEELGDLVRQLRDQLPSTELSEEERAEAEAELQTIEAQARSPRPKSVIIKESLSVARDILIKVAPPVLTELVNRYLAQLPG